MHRRERLPARPGKRQLRKLLEGELIELPPAELSNSEIAEKIYLCLISALTAAYARGQARDLDKVHHETALQTARDTDGGSRPLA
jgi:hypothetical protein